MGGHIQLGCKQSYYLRDPIVSTPGGGLQPSSKNKFLCRVFASHPRTLEVLKAAHNEAMAANAAGDCEEVRSVFPQIAESSRGSNFQSRKDSDLRA